MMNVPMKSEGIAFGIAGIAFGLIAGWIIGTQQATVASPAAAPAAATAPAAGDQPRAAILDEARVTALKSVAASGLWPVILWMPSSGIQITRSAGVFEGSRTPTTTYVSAC